MQGKGIIKTILALLVLVTLYQLFLFMKTNGIEKAGADQCGGTSNTCYAEYLDKQSSADVLSIPGIRKYTYSDLKKQQIGLGLDLKGGMSAVLQVDLKDHLMALADKAPEDDEMFDLALKNTSRQLNNVQQDYLATFGAEWDKISNDRKLGDIFIDNDKYNGRLTVNSNTAEVLDVLKEDTKDVVKQTYQMLVQRIDKLGVVQPNITLDEGRNLILAELPGVENPKRAREMLEKTAKLEFWKTYSFDDAYLGLQQYDNYLKGLDSTYVNKTEGPLSEVFQMGSIGGAIVGTVKMDNRKIVDSLLSEPAIRKYVPGDMGFRIAKMQNDDDGVKNEEYFVYAIRMGSDKIAKLNGSAITDSDVQNDPNQGGIGVGLDMDSEGGQEWCRMTTEASKTGASIAIVLDGEVVSAPSVNNGPICGGSTRITGNFTMQEANDLSNILEIGALPAAPKIVQVNTVGPTLGQENINRSLKALAIGFILVLLFMIAYYSGAGVISIIALLANIVFILAALSSQGAIMTLPGIAGIVLTVGMAVDANVIIYERIREELRNGKSLLLAIKDGFQHSYSAIIDANITTFLTAAVLNYFGMGPIKGFAVVLMVGVVMSVFTAVLLGRLLIDWWTINRKKDLSFSMGWSERMFADLKIDWLGKRKMAYTFSAVVIIAGLISMFTQGFDLGVDFSGGKNYTVEFAKGENIDGDKIKSTLKPLFGNSEPIVKTIAGDASRFAITTKYNPADVDDVDAHVLKQLFDGVNSMVNTKVKDVETFQLLSSEGTKITASYTVEPTIAEDIKNSSIKAILAALALIFLYIFIRFRKWQFSLGAVAALFHDVLFTLGIFSLLWKTGWFSMEIDQAFIAAILTVVGYSINDTVVVFDRIREYINTYSGKSKKDLINEAVSSTVSRTVITSLTTLFVILMLFIFGAGSIKGFAFALLIGVLIGTYSSIFIATPVLHDFSGDLKAADTKKEKGSTLARKQAKI